MQPTSTASNPLFDRDFLLATMMGPNCVRFAEELTANIPLSPHMRVLDLGCGMGLSSIYLARTFGVRVFAADLWIKPSDNFARFRDFGLEDAVIPRRAEGHALPFGEGQCCFYRTYKKLTEVCGISRHLINATIIWMHNILPHDNDTPHRCDVLPHRLSLPSA